MERGRPRITMKMMRHLRGLPQGNGGKTKGRALEMVQGQPQVHMVRPALWRSLSSLDLGGIGPAARQSHAVESSGLGSGPTSQLTGWVTLGKSLDLTVRFPHAENENDTLVCHHSSEDSALCWKSLPHPTRADGMCVHILLTYCSLHRRCWS